MAIPIVDPTNPKTNSMLGISKPVINDTVTITMVNHLNLESGICELV